MPQRIEIPPEGQRLGAKYVEFRPGRHEIDLYRNLHSARVLYTSGDLAMEAGVPTGDRFLDLKAGFKAIPKRAGLTAITWHTLRHTFASRLTRSGVDLVTVKELLGH